MNANLVFILFTVLLCLNQAYSAVKYTVLCNNAAEPTIGDIVTLISPIEIDNLQVDTGKSSHEGQYHGALFNAWKSIVISFSRLFYHTKFPLAFLVSDGVFRINRSKLGGLSYYSDVVLLQQKPLLQQWACSGVHFFLGSEISGVEKMCGCWNGRAISEYAEILPPSVGSPQNWCALSDPCAGAATSAVDDECQLSVDPFHSACVGYLSQSDDISEVTYKLEVPTIGSVGWGGIIISTLEWASNCLTVLPLTIQSLLNIDGLWLSLQLRKYSEDTLIFLEKYIFPVLFQWVPVYPTMMFVAWCLLSVEDSVASSPVTKYVVASVFGIFVAVIWVVILFYRLSSYMLKNNLPMFGGIFHSTLSALFMGSSLLLTTHTFQEYIFDRIVDLWVEGAFGVPWLGKAYFLFSVAISLFLARRWKMFEEYSNSHTILRMFLRSLGAVLVLTRCSPNMEISCILAVAAMNRDTLLEWAHYLWITAAAARQTPTYLYSSQPLLSTDEYERQGAIHTRIALAKLRDHLKTPEGKEKMYNMRPGRRFDFSLNLHRFSKGHYSGKPVYDSDGEIIDDFPEDEYESHVPRSSSIWPSLLILSVVFLVIAVIAINVPYFIDGDMWRK